MTLIRRKAAPAQRPFTTTSLTLLSAALASAIAYAAPAVISLTEIDGSNGVKINGELAFDTSGGSVSGAGDINGDGIDDLIIGASESLGFAGSAYVVFGQLSDYMSPLALAELNGSNGFKLVGEEDGDSAGVSVSAAGDINGDGIDDLVIGARTASPNGLTFAGSTYVVFGRVSGFTSPLALSALNGSDGFKIDGEAPSDYAGGSVSAAGDVNGDGIGDLIIGARGANPAGRSYVVFGRASGFTTPLALSSLDGNNGFKIDGEAVGDYSGVAVSGAGDVNDDGFDDVIIGAVRADPNGLQSAGSSYVVFGRGSGFPATLELSSLDGGNGFKITGEAEADYSGRSVSGAGDVNGDGIDDLIIGADYADSNGFKNTGSSYVVFGRAAGFTATLALSSLNGSNGFKLNGAAGSDRAGGSVSGAGDVNGDGIDDLIIGAVGTDPSGPSSGGSSYVVFGRRTGFTSPLALAALNGSDGFILNGEAGDFSAESVAGAGDINGDGVDDLTIGAPGANPDNMNNAGRSYVVFGVRDLIHVDSFEAETIARYDLSGQAVMILAE